MNDERNLPMDDEALSQFEGQLRRQRLGPGPRECRDLMYECGYAAGSATARNATKGAVTRWKVVSLVASALACLSTFSHFFEANVHRDEKIGINQRIEPHLQPSLEGKSRSATNAWVMHLTREKERDQLNDSTLRASGVTLDTKSMEELGHGWHYAPSSPQSAPLRPSDFQILL